MSVFTDCLVAKTSTHSEALECISGNGVPACMRRGRGWKRLGESEAATSWCLFPSSSVPPRCPPSSPELINVVFVEFGLLWITCGPGRGRDAVGRNWGRGRGCEGAQGHCRRSSVSDRENAITTSSAPWSMLCCGSWLI